MMGGHASPTFQNPKFFNETKVLDHIMITISFPFLSLGTNKYPGKCILGQPETLSFQSFLGEHAPRPP